MPTQTQSEELLRSWVKLSGIIKNTRITKGLMYNEAIVMFLLYERYRDDGVGLVSIKEITQKTRMLKSLVNRTVNSLEKKNFLERCEAKGDKRIAFVRCVEEKLGEFLEIHNYSLELVNRVIDVIGEDDTEAFIRLVNKIENAVTPSQPKET